MTPRTIEQNAGPDHIGVNEIPRIINASIDMGFGREIDHRVELMFGHQRVHLVGVGDVGLEKLVAIAVFLHYPVEVGQISGIGQHIDIADQCLLMMLQNVANEIAANKSATAGYQNTHSAR